MELDLAQSTTLTDFSMCINHYRLSTPGMFVCIHVPVQLDRNVRIVPGLVGQINSGKFKQSGPKDFKYFKGPPNFVFDVFQDHQQAEYQDRYKKFENSGVIEYVAWFSSQDLPIWSRRIENRFVTVEQDSEGLIKSTALPGLWIPVGALKNRDWWVVMATISRGITRRGHRDFMATIWRD